MSDARYYRPASPTRKLVAADRSSAAGYDPYHEKGRPRDGHPARDPYVSPRSSGERLGPGSTTNSGATDAYSNQSTRSSAYAGAYAGRTRRSTLESAEGSPYAATRHGSLQSGKPIIIHTHDRGGRPASPLSRQFDRDSTYLTTAPSHSRHKRVSSVDDRGGGIIAVAPTTNNYDSWGIPEQDRGTTEKHKHRERDRSHQTSSTAEKPRTVDEAYSFTDAAGMFRETEPRSRRRRGSVDGRSRDRPTSLLETQPGYDYSSQRSPRDHRPPPATRGLERFNEGVTRGSSVRDPRDRSNSRERSTRARAAYDREPEFLGINRAATFDMPLRPNSTRPPTDLADRDPPLDQQDSRYPHRAETYDDRAFREPRLLSRNDRRFTDREVENRGFGILSGIDHRGQDRSVSRDGRLDPAIPPAGYMGDALPLSPTEPPRDAGFYERNDDARATHRRTQHRDPDTDHHDDAARPRHKHGEEDYEYDEYDRGARMRDHDRQRERRHEDGHGMDAGIASAGALAAGAYVAHQVGDRHKERRSDDESGDKRDHRRPRSDDEDDYNYRTRDRDHAVPRHRDRDAGRDEDREQRRDRRHAQDDDSDHGGRRSERDTKVNDSQDRSERSGRADAEGPDADEEYRRRVQAEYNTLARQEPLDDDRGGLDRPGQDREITQGGVPELKTTSGPPPGSEGLSGPKPRGSEENFHDEYHESRARGGIEGGLTQEPDEMAPPHAMPPISSDNSDSGSSATRSTRVRIVEPPKEEKEAPGVRSILKKPTMKFPEDPNPIREGVAPLKDPKKEAKVKEEGIPSNARWTKIDRNWVNPQALDEAGERYEERMDCVIVLRVLTKHEVEKLADRTKKIREERDRKHRKRHDDDNDEDDPSRRSERDKDRDRDRGDRDRDRDRERDRDGRKGGGRRDRKRDNGGKDSSDEEYERLKREKEKLEREMRREREGRERPRQLEAAHDR